MSLAPVSVRYDAVNPESIVAANNKIIKSFDAMRTSTGQITSSVKQMESGFRADVMGGFANAVTNADTKVTGFKAKLAGIGTQFSQNATSFGVATASIWGVYNAYDSLEKVQIRAHAAAQRVATLETTVKTLTDRRTDAVTRGNASATDMAILDERITNAKGKLAVAQERDADLQQDVNEAWAGFASQVGPQAIAAGASIIQLVTNLRGSMSGIIPAIKGFFGAFTTGGPQMAVVRSESLLLRPALGGITTGMEGATVATKGLSLAMKGLLISTGIGAVIAIGAAIAEWAIGANEASAAVDTTAESMGGVEGAMDGATTSITQGNREIVVSQGNVKTGLQDIVKLMEDDLTAAAVASQEQMLKNNETFIQGFKDRLTIAQETLNTLKNTEPQGLELLLNIFTFGGKRQEDIQNAQKAVTDLKTKIDALTPAQEQNTATTQKNKEAYQQLVLPVTNITEFLQKATLEWQKAREASTGVEKLFGLEQLAKSGADLTALMPVIDSFVDGLQKMFDPNNVTPEFFAHIKELLKQDVAKWQKEGADAAKDHAKQLKDEADAEKKLAEEAQKRGEEIKQHVKEQVALNEAEQKSVDAVFQGIQLNTLDEKTRAAVVEVAKAQEDVILNHNKALVEEAAQLGLNIDNLGQYLSATVDNTTALNNFIAENLNYTRALTDQALKQKLVSEGFKAAIIDTDNFVQSLVKTEEQTLITTNEQRKLAEEFGLTLPKGIQFSTEELKKFNQAQFLTKTGTFEIEKALRERLSPALERFQGILSATSDKDFSKAWKDLKEGEFLKGVPKSLRQSIKDIGEDLEKVNKKGQAANNTISALLLNASQGRQKGNKAGLELLVETLEKMPSHEDLQPIIDWLKSIIDTDSKLRPAAIEQYAAAFIALQQAMDPNSENGVFISPGERELILEKINEAAGKSGDVDKYAQSIDGLTTSLGAFGDVMSTLRQTLLGPEQKSPDGKFSWNITDPFNVQKTDGGGAGGGDLQDKIDQLTQLSTLIQTTQTGFQTLATEGSKSLATLVKNAKAHVTTLMTYFGKTVPQALGETALAFAETMSIGQKALALLISSAKAHVTTLNTYFGTTIPVAAQKSQTSLANLANQGANSLSILARASSSQMNGLINNMKAGETAVHNLQSAINSLHSKTITVKANVSGPGVKFLAEGFHGVVDKPTLFIAGEAGPERIDVSKAPGAVPSGTNEVERQFRITPVLTDQSSKTQIFARNVPALGQTIVNYLHVEIPVYLGQDRIEKIIKDLVLSNTGMFSQ